MIPVIEREVVEKKQWIDEAELADMLAVAGTAPGGVGVNSAAFVGYRKAGIPGAIVSVAGITLPTLIIVIALSFLYSQIHDHPKVIAAMKGIHYGIVALILAAAYRMIRTSVFDTATAIVTIAAVCVLVMTHTYPTLIIACGIFGGIAVVKGKELAGLQVKTERSVPRRGSPEDFYPEYYI